MRAIAESALLEVTTLTNAKMSVTSSWFAYCTVFTFGALALLPLLTLVTGLAYSWERQCRPLTRGR